MFRFNFFILKFSLSYCVVTAKMVSQSQPIAISSHHCKQAIPQETHVECMITQDTSEAVSLRWCQSWYVDGSGPHVYPA